MKFSRRSVCAVIFWRTLKETAENCENYRRFKGIYSWGAIKYPTPLQSYKQQAIPTIGLRKWCNSRPTLEHSDRYFFFRGYNFSFTHHSAIRCNLRNWTIVLYKSRIVFNVPVFQRFCPSNLHQLYVFIPTQITATYPGQYNRHGSVTSTVPREQHKSQCSLHLF
jgi:hypothetical protein